MRRSNTQEARVELKYCEHCGGLWVREPGTGVYCAKCEPKVADLPVPKKRAGRVSLPQLGRSVADDIRGEIHEEVLDLEAVGGVA